MKPKNNKTNQQTTSKRSFIERARRSQIIEATIVVLAENGYTNTTFVRIAEQAGIRPGLISYYFKNKDELTYEVLAVITHDRLQHIQQQLANVTSAREKLRTVLESDLAHMGTQPQRFQASIEIMFNHHNVKGALDFLAETDTLMHLVRNILLDGQKNGEFGEFDAVNLAIIIDAARDSFLAQLSHHSNHDLEAFTKTLVNLALSATKKEDK